MTIRSRRLNAQAFADRVAAFTSAVREGEARSSKLLGPTPRLEQSSDTLRETLDALRAEHEELTVADEELRTQLEELTRMGLLLEAERTRYADLFESAPDAYLVTDRFGAIRDANAAALELIGVRLRYLRGKPLAAFVAGPDVRRLHALHDALEASAQSEGGVGSPRLLDLTIRSRKGDEIPTTARVTVTSRGQRLLWSIRPGTTAPPAAGDAARALRDKEELLARERRAREELERTSRAKDRFIAVLAHDLRAPLNAVLGWTQLLRREVLDHAARTRALETIERNARAQAKLIEELLDVSRIAADRLQLALTPIDAGEFVQRVVQGFLPQAAEAGLEIEVAVDERLTVLADPERLEQVLTNLLSNAVKFTPRGGRIWVAARRADREVAISIKDTGRGMERALLPRVFDLYTQDRARAESRVGLGLGLHIAKQLVEVHDGTVSVDSEGPDRGATFTVCLPLHDEIAPPKTSEMQAPAPVALADVRVLVVDDEEDARELMATILRRAGADVAAAGDPRVALDVFTRWAPDVVVSDLAMGASGDGCDLVRAVRAQDPTVGALAVSGFSAAEDVDRALAAGFDVHIGKPVDATELVEAVFEAVRSRR